MEKQKINYGDIINKYIMTKVKMGYEPFCTNEEIEQFLNFARNFVTIEPDNVSANEILEHYLNGPRSKNKVWSIKKADFEFIPTVIKTDSGLIVPTYELNYSSNFDVYKDLNNCIETFLKKNGKVRTIEQEAIADEDTINFSSNTAATILLDVWNDKIRRLINNDKWPYQCQDIKKYLIEMDLAPIIGLDAMQEKLLTFYYTIQNRIMNIAKNDPSFTMTNLERKLLAKANFDAVMQGYSYFRSISDSMIEFYEYFVINRGTNEIKYVIDHYEGNIKTKKLDSPEVVELAKVLKK